MKKIIAHCTHAHTALSQGHHHHSGCSHSRSKLFSTANRVGVYLPPTTSSSDDPDGNWGFPLDDLAPPPSPDMVDLSSPGQVIDEAVKMMSQHPVTPQLLSEVSKFLSKNGAFRVNDFTLKVHIGDKHGHHRHRVASDFPTASLSLVMHAIDKELIELCLCAPVDLDELGGAVSHVEHAVNSLDNPSDGGHASVLDDPSASHVGFAVGAIYLAIFGIYFGLLNVRNGQERVQKLMPYREKVEKLIARLETIASRDDRCDAMIKTELSNMKAYLDQINLSVKDGRFQSGSGAALTFSSASVIAATFVSALSPMATIGFSIYGAAHVAKYSTLLAKTVSADRALKRSDQDLEEIRRVMRPFLDQKYKVYGSLITCFGVFTGSSTVLTAGILAGASAVGGPVTLAVVASMLVGSALAAAYLNNVSANRFAPKNQDYHHSRLLWGNANCVASRMAACSDLKAVASEFGRAPRIKSPFRFKETLTDKVKLAGYWAGTVATMGVLPKFVAPIRDFKTRYDVSHSRITQDKRHELITRYCDRVLEMSEKEMPFIESDIADLTGSISQLSEESVKKLLSLQLVLKLMLRDKLVHEIDCASAIKTKLANAPGEAYADFLKLTHMDEQFSDTMETVFKGSKKVTDSYRTETKLEAKSVPLSYMGGCGHSHKGHSHKGHSHEGHSHEGHSHCSHSHDHGVEVAYDFAGVMSGGSEGLKARYEAVFDRVVGADLKRHLDEEWVKRGHHLQSVMLSQKPVCK